MFKIVLDISFYEDYRESLRALMGWVFSGLLPHEVRGGKKYFAL